MVAACGVPVAKMSGRGLGFSGGTIDKIESIPGYRVALSDAAFRAQAEQIGIVLTSQSANLAPADGKLYALRDVTATVSSLPLIASSIMSKKIAGGAKAIVLDVKVGLGAFMTHIAEAKALARLMVGIGQSVGREVVALISDMNQPLGCAVGNALEVEEAIACLRGGGPKDLREHCLAVAGYMLMLARKNQPGRASLDDMQAVNGCIEEAAATLDDGRAFEKFRQLVAAQGGDVRMVDDPGKLPKARFTQVIEAEESGYIEQLSALDVGMLAVELGAGRERKDEPINHAVGLLVHKKVGDQVAKGDALFTIHADEETKFALARRRLEKTIVYSQQMTLPLPIFYDVITA
jgi:pyrimidine-nucleoside phosphorylase